MSNQPPETMKAIIRNRYGGPEVVEVAEIDRPEPDDDQLLVRVKAASLNRADRYAVTGQPLVSRPMQGMRKPKTRQLGTDYSGVVEAVGKNVSGFRPGDEVFGGRDGALAEYVCARYDRGTVLKPTSVTFEQAAAVPVAALTALQGLRDKAEFRQASGSLSRERREGSARLRCRSPKPSVPRSLRSSARRASISPARLGAITSSTTRRMTSPGSLGSSN